MTIRNLAVCAVISLALAQRSRAEGVEGALAQAGVGLQENLQGASAVAASAAAQGSPEKAAAQGERSIQTLVGEKPAEPVSATAQSRSAPEGAGLSLKKPLKPPRQFGFHGFDNGFMNVCDKAGKFAGALGRPFGPVVDKAVGKVHDMANSDSKSESFVGCLLCVAGISLLLALGFALFLGCVAVGGIAVAGGFLGAIFGARKPADG